MKLFRIAVVVVAVGALAGAPAARAATAHGRIAYLAGEVRRLRTRLGKMTIVRNKTKQDLSEAQAEVASLQASLQERTSQGDAALAEVASLQAEIAAIPTPLTVAVEQVRREVTYSEKVLDDAGVPFSYGQLVSQAATDYVVGHVNAPAYGFITTVLDESVPATPDAILGDQAGICGDAALTFAAIVKQFGLDVRSVQFYYGPDGSWNHISDEVDYDGAWHYFDPTFGVNYERDGDVLSITDARAEANPESLLRQDNTLFWTSVVTQAGNTELGDISFATDPATTVEIAQQPFTG